MIAYTLALGLEAIAIVASAWGAVEAERRGAMTLSGALAGLMVVAIVAVLATIGVI